MASMVTVPSLPPASSDQAVLARAVVSPARANWPARLASCRRNRRRVRRPL